MVESVDCDLERHFEEQQMLELISVCCGSPVYTNEFNDDVCMECQDTCEVMSKGEWLYNQRIDAECDAADAKKELERENETR